MVYIHVPSEELNFDSPPKVKNSLTTTLPCRRFLCAVDRRPYRFYACLLAGDLAFLFYTVVDMD